MASMGWVRVEWGGVGELGWGGMRRVLVGLGLVGWGGMGWDGVGWVVWGGVG